jgi:hypothetical protein
MHRPYQVERPLRAAPTLFEPRSRIPVHHPAPAIMVMPPARRSRASGATNS